MTRNLKALGLAFVAVCAMGAVMASAASAQGKITSDGAVTLVGTETGLPSANALSAFGSTIECETTLTGYKTNSTTNPKALIAPGDTSYTVPLHHFNCVAGGNPATVKMTSCDTTITVGGAPTYATISHLVCSVPGDEIHVEVYSDAAHTNRICTVTFGAQTRTGANLSNGAGGHINLNGTFTNIVAKREGLCLLDGKGTNTSAATWATDITFAGKNSVGEATAISVS